MSECVVRMEMPKNCFKCPLHKFGGTCGLLTGITAEERMNIDKRRPSQCPIICSLPEGHGRLVDAEALDFGKVFVGASDFAQDCRDGAQSVIDSAPTIVPAKAERSET